MVEKLVWIGPRESDIQHCGIEFFRSVTYNGTNTGNNRAYTSYIHTRINPYLSNKWDPSKFVQQELRQLRNDPQVHFMFYNPFQCYLMKNGPETQTLCLNDRELIDFLRNKSNLRELAQHYIPITPYVSFSGSIMPDVTFSMGDGTSFILQEAISSGGYGTFHLSPEECASYLRNRGDISYILSPYLEDAIPINVHVVIFENDVLVLPPSYQIIQHHDPYLLYLGADFHTDFTDQEHNCILDRATSLAQVLRQYGYRGICGMDFMFMEHEAYLLEINPRFQASSFLMNKLLREQKLSSLHQLNLMAFNGERTPFQSFSKFSKPNSFFTVMGSKCPSWYDQNCQSGPSVISQRIQDGFRSDMKLESQAYLFRAISEQNLCWRDVDGRLTVAPNLIPDSQVWRNQIIAGEPLALKIGLLNQGIRIMPDAQIIMEQQGQIRQGVFQSVDLTFPNGLVINTPYHSRFSELSPYSIHWNGKQFCLYYEDIQLSSVTFDPADPYQARVASGGTVYRTAAFWATDRLRVHHQFRCKFKMEGCGCKFCNVKLKTGKFSLDDVCQVIDFYLDHTEFRHFLIGGGSGDDHSESEHIIALAKHIRNRCDKAIYAMCLPPKDLSVLERYHEAGIDEIGFNLELFDRSLAQKIMPGKGQLPLARYEAAFRRAVELWGRSGAVRSLMVLGLESRKSFLDGIQWLCKLGVMPIISVFRPVEHIELQYTLPYGNEELAYLFYQAERIAKRYGLIVGPTCVACQNNTLSLPHDPSFFKDI